MLANSRLLEFHWPVKANDGEAICMFPHQNIQFPVLIISNTGIIRVPVKNKANRLIFPSKDMKLELLRAINANPLVSISEEKFREDPCIEISDLLETGLIDSFFDAIDGLIERIKNTPIPVEEEKPKPVGKKQPCKIVHQKAKSAISRPKNRNGTRGSR